MPHPESMEAVPVVTVITCRDLERLGMHSCAHCCRRCHDEGDRCPDEFTFEVMGMKLELCCGSSEAIEWTSATFARVRRAAEPLHAAG